MTLEISERQQNNEVEIFEHCPVGVSRWDSAVESWRSRGVGQFILYYNTEQGLPKIVFSDEDKTQLLQFIDGKDHPYYFEEPDEIFIEWSGTDYTWGRNKPIDAKWRMEFDIDDEIAAQKIHKMFKFYVSKNIDPSDLLVSGYLRLHCNHHKNENIPTDLEVLCHWMYNNLFADDIEIEHKMDEWRPGISHKQLEFIESCNTVTKSMWPNTCFNAFGTLVISKGMIKVWRLKLFSIDPDLCFGIVDADRFEENKNKLFFDEENSFGIYTKTGCKYQNKDPMKADYIDRECEQNDLITMTLNMTGVNEEEFGILSYKINNMDYGVAFDNIDINKRYYMAISILNPTVAQLLQ